MNNLDLKRKKKNCHFFLVLNVTFQVIAKWVHKPLATVLYLLSILILQTVLLFYGSNWSGPAVIFAPTRCHLFTFELQFGHLSEVSWKNPRVQITGVAFQMGPFFLSALGQVRLLSTINEGCFRTEARNGLQNNNGLQKGFL